MRRKRVQLEQAVMSAAFEFRAALAASRWDGYTIDAPTSKAIRSLEAAVEALAALQPDDITNAPGRWVEGSPETSQAAALTNPRLGTVRRRIVDEFRIVANVAGPGLTIDEVEARLRGAHTTISSAINHLVQTGWLQDSGFVRLTKSKRDAVIWELTPAGRNAQT